MSRRMIRTGAGFALALGLAVPLTACADLGPVDNIVEGLVQDQVDQFSEGVQEQVSEALGGADFTLDGTLPDGFPTEVPLVSDEILRGGSGADGAGWAVQVRIPDATAFEAARQQLESAGFAASGVSADAQSGFGVFTSDAYRVTLTVTAEPGEPTATYIVAPV